MEWLKEILGEKLYKEVKVILDEKNIKLGNIGDGSYIPKEKFDNKIEENKLLKEQVEENKKNSKELEKTLKDKLSKEHKEEISNLIKEFDNKLEIKDKEIINMNKTEIAKKILTENKAVDPDLLLKAVDLDSVEIDGDNLKNFDVKELQTKYPKQFAEVKTKGNVTPGKPDSLDDSTKRVQLIEQYNKTSDITQRHILRKQINELKVE